MQIGKLSIQDLKELVLKNIKNNREEVISNPKIGGDCAIVQCGEDKLIYLSSDPITAATNSLGKLAVHINANDIATSGTAPLGIMLTILAPQGTTKTELENIILEAQAECDKLNISILGGHTEITDAVNRIVLSVTAIGIGERKAFERREDVEPGDYLVITKGVGIEGTGIIASEKEDELKSEFGEEFVENAKRFLDRTSVVRDGEIAGKYTKGMHDVTEGGILGAVWEMADLYDLGVELDIENFEIETATLKISEYLKIDPLKLISSGTMLISVAPEDLESLRKELFENNIENYIVGRFTKNREKTYLYKGIKREIEPPLSDELYKVL